MALLCSCGLRRSEAQGLVLEQVDLPQSLICVRGKGNKEREAAITPSLGPILAWYLASPEGNLTDMRRCHGRTRSRDAVGRSAQELLVASSTPTSTPPGVIDQIPTYLARWPAPADGKPVESIAAEFIRHTADEVGRLACRLRGRRAPPGGYPEPVLANPSFPLTAVSGAPDTPRRPGGTT